MPDGDIAYTRDGTFQLNAEGTDGDADGYLVQPGIVVPEDAIDVTINASGEVLAKLRRPGRAAERRPDPARDLPQRGRPGSDRRQPVARDRRLRRAVLGSPCAPGYGSVLQGSLETSNVNAVAEITNLISAQRAYEMNSKVISTTDQMMTTTSQLR